MPVVVLDKCMVQTVQKTAVSQFWVVAVPVVVQRQVPGLVQTVLKTVEILQLSAEQLVFAEVQLCAPSASGKPSTTKSSSSSRAGGWL